MSQVGKDGKVKYKINGPEVKRLHDLGLALHWLKHRSKKPIDDRWTTGPRKFLDELRAQYRPGMNLGVRLGSVSKLEGGYLSVIDCDVKSNDLRHAEELDAKLKDLGLDVYFDNPTVASGRRNGSRHIYVLTQEPIRARRLSQSKEKVKLLMPSATDKDPSRFEREHLSEEEIKAGYRIRPAWEISVMGEGQQVVLPPSIHPDSGKRYKWTTKLTDPKKIRIYTGAKADPKAERESDKAPPFRPVAVDLIGSKLPSRIVDQIISGEGVEDRSAAMLGVCNSMLKHGFTDDEILSVLTDRENFLGEAGYAHAQTEDRSRAARWVRDYTLGKSKRETLAQFAFDDLVEVEPAPLSDEEAKEQEAELSPPKDWEEQIERGSEENGYRPKNTLKNVILILQGVAGVDVFKRDEFSNTELYGRVAPWGSKIGAEVTDVDTVMIKTWLADHWRFEPSNDRIEQAVIAIAYKNRFHPVRDYLDGLEWDGVSRIDTWLKDYLSAKGPEPYLSAVSRKVLVAMVKRIYEPGSKFDHVLILEGFQGAGKSTALKNLAGDAWFTDAKFDVTDKDAILTMRSKWLIELGELSGMRSADVEDLKAFVSRTTDRIRVPYGKRSEDFPRQCIFIGSTNRDEYLKDPTGNRRFWPVKLVGKCDFGRVARDREQLLAEARFAYELGEPTYLEEEEMEKVAVREQEKRSISDSWDEILANWIAGGAVEREDELVAQDGGPRIDRRRFSILDLFSDFGPLSAWKPNQPEVKRAGDALRKLGYEKYLARVDGVPKKVWEPKREIAGLRAPEKKD